MHFRATLDYARALDQADVLAPFRAEFHLPPKKIYLDGNSLGLLPRRAETEILAAVAQWRNAGIAGWREHGWFDLAERLGAQTAPLIGADPREVLVANSTTVNLHQLLATLFRPNPHSGRTQIIATSLDFPTDIYALQSHLALHGLAPTEHLVRIQSHDGLTLSENSIIDALSGRVALILLPTVLYTSGQLLAVAKIAQAARDKNIIVGLDCSHSIGVVPHDFKSWGIDFAVWCNYKYLNGGPGAAGGLYLNQRHFPATPGLAGWFGSRKDRQFNMAHEFEPAPCASSLQIGTPNILSMAPLIGALELPLEAGIERIRKKSIDLTTFLIQLTDLWLTPFGIGIGTPRDPERRGGHVALRSPEARRLSRALELAGVVVDHRAPDIVRLTPAPLYVSFEDCFRAMEILREILRDNRHLKLAPERALIP